jgi:GTPase SAR1 family protein
MPLLETVHASCVLIGEHGILIRGPAGSGKSTLARTLVTDAGRIGRYAAHVADDRTRLEARNGRLVGRPVPAIAGKLEIRGAGLLSVSHEPAAVIHLVLDLSAEPPPRFPDDAEGATVLCDIAIRRLLLQSGTPCSDLIQAWARNRDLTSMTV